MDSAIGSHFRTQDMQAVHRVRIGLEDVHYRGNLVAGAFLLQLCFDAGTELMLKIDGDAGLLRAIESAEFLAPVQAGDYLEIKARLLATGNTSRRIDYTVSKYLEMGGQFPSSGRVLDPPILVARAVGVGVVPKERQGATTNLAEPKME